MNIMKNLNYQVIILFSMLLLANPCVSNNVRKMIAEEWEEIELQFISADNYENSYTDVDFWLEFYHSTGDTIIRPGFWNGENKWIIRFASSKKNGKWSWKSFSSNNEDAGLNNKKGKIFCKPYSGNNQLIKHGFFIMSEGKRNVIHADGTPFLLIGDTPWVLPWRGTVESVKIYAKNRESRGFNTALLMSLQPYKGAESSRNRNEEGGFGVAFEDLKRADKLHQVLGPLGWKDHMVNYPIPQEEIDLTQMEQNMGY